MQDFEPYFCTVEECDAPFDLTNTFEGLLQHLQERHVEECFHVDLPNGEHKEFDEAGIEDYFTQRGGISEENFAIFKGAARRKGAYLFESCPFCGGYPDVLEKHFPDHNTPEAQIQLRRHVKTHMQTIALFFPPYREDAFDNKADARSTILSSVPERAHRSAASQMLAASGLGSPQDFRSICSTEDCDCKDKGRLSADELSELLRIPVSADTDEISGDGDFWADISQGLSRCGHTALTEEDCREDPILSHLLTREHTVEKKQSPWGLASGKRPASDNHNQPLDDVWRFSVTQIPAETLEQQFREMPTPTSPSVARLCSRCSEMEVWTEPFRIVDRPLDLEQSCTVCDFCLVRWNICQHLGIHTVPNVVFDKSGSHITVNERYPPVLSIFQGPGMWTLSETGAIGSLLDVVLTNAYRNNH